MSKKIKMAYFAVIALSIILFVVDLAIGRYNGAIIVGLSAVWLFFYYRLFKVVEGYQNLCAEYSKEIVRYKRSWKTTSRLLINHTRRRKNPSRNH